MSILLWFENRCGLYTDSEMKSPFSLVPRGIVATVPRWPMTGPTKSRAPASVSLCRYTVCTTLGSVTGPTVKSDSGI